MEEQHQQKKEKGKKKTTRQWLLQDPTEPIVFRGIVDGPVVLVPNLIIALCLICFLICLLSSFFVVMGPSMFGYRKMVFPRFSPPLPIHPLWSICFHRIVPSMRLIPARSTHEHLSREKGNEEKKYGKREYLNNGRPPPCRAELREEKKKKKRLVPPKKPKSQEREKKPKPGRRPYRHKKNINSKATMRGPRPMITQKP
ncbi:hypothetical protein LX32DRAFT_646998 [Colletotrichum zoysiae]|uniref:Uncharacterized protein n=1 Tax=Colletotrichum zoysiae TaxID=1216348 RepID=A0AAD9LT40_9PEZI|nr:hypothetical protein LX32DRAFT_646998 [Colletotrichum zoysiae]